MDVPSELVVTVDGQSSVGVLVQYEGPLLSLLAPSDVYAVIAPPASDRGPLTLFGANFGLRYRDGLPADHSVLIGNATCGAVTWVSDGEVVCTPVGEFVVGPHHATVVVAGRRSNSVPLPSQAVRGGGGAVLGVPRGCPMPRRTL